MTNHSSSSDEILPIFIGYDSRQDAAFRTCVASLEKTTSAALRIEAMNHRELRRLGLFTRRWITDARGQYFDELDGKPFSTEFSHSRFLLPYYARHLGIVSGWALFIDSDFLFLHDVAELFSLANDAYAIMCVKHEHLPNNADKMDGVAQQRYFRKNWSSCMLWNLDHVATHELTLAQVNENPGSWLHSFAWLDDKYIGDLPVEWNWLAGTSDPNIVPKAVHHTDGGPWFADYANAPYAREWHLAHLDAQTKQLSASVSALRKLRA